MNGRSGYCFRRQSLKPSPRPDIGFTPTSWRRSLVWPWNFCESHAQANQPNRGSLGSKIPGPSGYGPGVLCVHPPELRTDNGGILPVASKRASGATGLGQTTAGRFSRLFALSRTGKIEPCDHTIAIFGAADFL